MPRLTEAILETLNYCFDKAATQEGRILSPWEQRFLQDQRERFAQYGEFTAFSDKSWEIVERIESALIDQRSTRRR